MSDETWQPLTRDQLLGMLNMAARFIRRGQTDVALKQIEYLVDSIEVDLALDQMNTAREYGVNPEVLCQ